MYNDVVVVGNSDKYVGHEFLCPCLRCPRNGRLLRLPPRPEHFLCDDMVTAIPYTSKHNEDRGFGSRLSPDRKTWRFVEVPKNRREEIEECRDVSISNGHIDRTSMRRSHENPGNEPKLLALSAASRSNVVCESIKSHDILLHSKLLDVSQYLTLPIHHPDQHTVPQVAVPVALIHKMDCTSSFSGLICSNRQYRGLIVKQPSLVPNQPNLYDDGLL